MIQYELPCGSNNVNENVDAVINDLLTIIRTCTDKKVEENLNNLNYKIIKEIIIE